MAAELEFIPEFVPAELLPAAEVLVLAVAEVSFVAPAAVPSCPVT